MGNWGKLCKLDLRVWDLVCTELRQLRRDEYEKGAVAKLGLIMEQKAAENKANLPQCFNNAFGISNSGINTQLNRLLF